MLVITLPPFLLFGLKDLFYIPTVVIIMELQRRERSMAAEDSMFLSHYRLNLLGRAPGDRSMSLLSVPSATLARSSRSSPKVGTPQTCLLSCQPKTQTMSSVFTAAATLLPRWLNDTYLSVRPSRTVLHLQGGMTAEQTKAENCLV